jgi:hypothetical protein
VVSTFVILELETRLGAYNAVIVLDLIGEL